MSLPINNFSKRNSKYCSWIKPFRPWKIEVLNLFQLILFLIKTKYRAIWLKEVPIPNNFKKLFMNMNILSHITRKLLKSYKMKSTSIWVKLYRKKKSSEKLENDLAWQTCFITGNFEWFLLTFVQLMAQWQIVILN